MVEESKSEIVIREDPVFGFGFVIDKIMHRTNPYINMLLRAKPFIPGIYRIRDGRTKKMTNDEINILSNEKVMWLKLDINVIKSILGTDQPPKYGTYMRDLRLYYGQHEMAWVNRPYLFLHKVEPIIKPSQQRLY